MSPAESRTRALAAARYPGQEVWCHASPPRGRASERHYILCGRTRTADFTLGGVAVLVGTVTFTRMFVHTVDEQAITRNAAQLAYNEVRAELDAAKAESTQIAVSSPFSWAKCPLSTEARVMIGGDPATGGKTINVDRAAPLEQQATTLLTAFRMVDLRLVATSQSQLRVVADNPTAGVSLFSCTNDSTEPAPAPAPTVVEVPSDPAPAAVQQ